MRKGLLLLAVAVAFPSLASAGVHNMGGCGLGAMIFRDNDKGQQILAATTNGTSGNQTFGITSGTLGCTEDGRVKLDRERIVFAESNLPSLKRDMASGNGQFIDSLASLYGFQAVQERRAFARFVQLNFEAIVPDETITASQMLINLDKTLAAKPLS